jgi:signal peptidase II
MKALKAVPASRYSVFFALAAVGCAVDLATKKWMFDWLGMPPSPTKPLCGDVLGFQTSLNLGALFGMGQGLWPFFSAVSVVAIVGILYWLFWAGAARDWLLTVSLGSISAGILGNLYDRLGLPGLTWAENSMRTPGERVHAVRDFILFKVGNYSWPNFNIADSLLVCGAAVLLWHALRPHKEAAEAQPQS